MRLIRLMLILVIIFKPTSTLFCQTTSYSNLLKSILELPLNDSNYKIINPAYTKQIIEDKLNSANTFLTIKLTHLMLGDSSKYYEEQLAELKKIEKKKLNNSTDSAIWLNEIEKQYLLISLLKPNKCDSVFFKLTKIWFDIKQPISFIGNSESLINYKIWLLEKAEERFKAETTYFTIKKESYYFKKALILCYSNYRNIVAEKNKLELIEKSLNISKRDSLLNYSYNTRALNLSEKNKTLQSDSLNTYIETLLLKAYKLKPKDYNTNYNLFVFYYNLGATIMRAIDYNISEKELNIMQKKAKQYFSKSTSYGEAIGIKKETEEKNKK